MRTESKRWTFRLGAGFLTLLFAVAVSAGPYYHPYTGASPYTQSYYPSGAYYGPAYYYGSFASSPYYGYGSPYYNPAANYYYPQSYSGTSNSSPGYSYHSGFSGFPLHHQNHLFRDPLKGANFGAGPSTSPDVPAGTVGWIPAQVPLRKNLEANRQRQEALRSLTHHKGGRHGGGFHSRRFR